MVLGEKTVSDATKGKEVVTESSVATTDAVEIKAENIHSSIANNFVSGEEKKPLVEEKKFSVLIVDDHYLTRYVHKTMVKSMGLEVYDVENGKIAVDLHRFGASFDLILMDRDMPVMNGEEKIFDFVIHKATRELRAMGVETMIVGVTAHDEGLTRQAFAESGLNEIFSKPINVPKLAGLVKVIKENNKKKAEKVATKDV